MRAWGKVLSIVVIASFIAAFSTLAHAASFDPALKWRTIRTEHFRINYPDHLEDIGQRAAQYYEEVHSTLSPELQWKPWGRTEVVLTDNTDEANGFTTVLPYNWMILYVVPPRADSVLGTYDDWLKLLITHEYTHTLHLDAARGMWKPLRFIFGRITSPAGMTPVWIKEGIATYEETKHTSGGRGRSTFTEMMIRTSVLEDQFPRIDEADGFGWEWPSYRIAYLYGVEFIEYLVDTYGEAKFIEFNKRVQRSLLLFMINHHAKNLYGKTFYQLWDEWYAKVKERYQHEQDQRGPATDFTSLFDSEKDARYLTPEYSPDGTKLAYAVESPHHAAEVRIFDVVTGKETIVRKKQGALAISWLPDGSGFVYSSIGSYKRYNSYYDLWKYTLADKKAVSLTKGKRARDPAVHPDGERVLMVTGSGGKSALEILSLKDKGMTPFEVEVPPDAQFFRPRWSPDGKRIAVTIHTKEEGWKLYLVSANGKKLQHLTKTKSMVSEVDAAWLPSGRHLLFSSDVSGISNIYRIDVQTRKIEQVTNTDTGLFHPTTIDGRTVIAQHYHSRGFDLKKFVDNQRRVAADVGQSVPSKGVILSESEESPLAPSPSKKYNALGSSLLLPRYLLPGFYFTGSTSIFSATTGSADPLRWHRWSAGATYRLDAAHLGYFGQYSYQRYRPVLGVSMNDYAVDFGRLTFLRTDGTLNTVRYFEERRGVTGSVTIPVKRHAFSTGYFYEDRFPKISLIQEEENALNTGIFSGFRMAYAYADPEFYPASISLENGRRIRLLTSVSDTTFGSNEENEQTIFSGDWREYIRLGGHQVLGLRAAGGMTWGDRLVQGTFGMGGALGEGLLAGPPSMFYFPLRGLPVSALSQTRAMLLSSEYRIPLLSPQRGLGTTPFYVKNIHGSLFADYGDAWNATDTKKGTFTNFFDDFYLGVGAELRGDFIVGHGLPLIGRLGYGIIVVNRDRLGTFEDDLTKAPAKYGVMILQFGTSF